MDGSTLIETIGPVVSNPDPPDLASAASPDVSPAALLAVVADQVRWRLLSRLADGRTRCVCELQPVAAVAGNLLSYHLKVLREARLVTATRRGRWMDYTITADALGRLHSALPTTPPADTGSGSGAATGAGSGCGRDAAGREGGDAR